MARGFLSGAIWGVVVSGLGLGLASVLSGPVLAPQPQARVEDPAGAAPPPPPADAPPSTRPQAPARPAIGADISSPDFTSPGVPDQPDVMAIPGVETAPPPVPQTAEVTEAPDAPADEDPPAAVPQVEAPVAPSPQAPQPEAPAAEDAASETFAIATDPGQPPAPSAGAPDVAQPGVPETPEVFQPPGVPEAPQTAGRPAPTAAPVQPESDARPEGAARADAGPADSLAAESAPDAPNRGREAAEAEIIADTVPLEPPAAGVDTPDAPEAPAAPDPAITEPPQAPRVPQVALPSPPPLVESEPPAIGRGASDLSRMEPGIPTDRLPATGAPEALEDGQATPATPPSPPPLEAFAAAAPVPSDQPLMSVVLIDDGTLPLGLEALEAFPYPLTFAVDTAWGGATQAMMRYRAAGFEVMALADVPKEATPSDVEVSLRAALDVVPEAVAVLEGDASGLQGSRAVSDQVSRILADTGHGLVLYPQGLNTAVSLAQREGIRAQALFRDFDGAGQDATVIRRFLDQAAFKAGQEGSVIMIGRLRADTISALLLWGLQDRARRVSLVPVSAVLSRDDDA